MKALSTLLPKSANSSARYWILVICLTLLTAEMMSQTRKTMTCTVSSVAEHTMNNGGESEVISNAATIKPQKTMYVRLAFHFLMPGGNVIHTDAWKSGKTYFGAGNFTETGDGMGDQSYNGYDFARDIIDNANFELQFPALQRRQNPEAVYANPPEPVRIQYLLAGVYFQRDFKAYYRTFAKYKLEQTHDKYAVMEDEIINVYLTPELRADGNASEYGGSEKWIFLRLYDRYMDPDQRDWVIEKFGPSVLNHEIAHSLSLRHTWDQDDLCDDTPMGIEYEHSGTPDDPCYQYAPCCTRWANCWAVDNTRNSCGSSPCDDLSKVSNNIMDYNGAFPHAFTSCQKQRMYADLIGPGSKYIYSVEDNEPALAVATVHPAYDCSNDIASVTIDARYSSNVDSYRFRILDKEARMQSDGNSEFISDWISGSPEELDIASVYDFEPEQEYTVELDVINSLNPLPHTYSEDIVIETCHQQIRNISFDVNNPAENFLQLDVTLQDPETISVFLASVYSRHTQSVLQDVELEPGKWNFSEDISQLVPGIYALTIVSETDVLTKTVVKP